MVIHANGQMGLGFRGAEYSILESSLQKFTFPKKLNPSQSDSKC